MRKSECRTKGTSSCQSSIVYDDTIGPQVKRGYTKDSPSRKHEACLEESVATSRQHNSLATYVSGVEVQPEDWTLTPLMTTHRRIHFGTCYKFSSVAAFEI